MKLPRIIGAKIKSKGIDNLFHEIIAKSSKCRERNGYKTRKCLEIQINLNRGLLWGTSQSRC